MRHLMRRTGFLVAALSAWLSALTITATANPTLLFDAKTERVLYAQDPDRLWYPASLTKIMTAYVVFDALKRGRIAMDSKLVSSERAQKEPPSKIGLPVGSEISLELGLRSLIIKSANDVAVMLAESVSGSVETFVSRMNATAKKLGMTRTHFVNANGLPVDGQMTTARDLARLALAINRDFPEHAHYWATPYMRIGKRRLRSHNSLLRTFEGADGIKTGFICDSGFNVVASATRGGRKLIAVVLGSPSAGDRNQRAAALLKHGFKTFEWKAFLNTATLASLPPSTNSNRLISIRDEVRGWSCGNRRRARAAARAKRRKVLRAKRRRAAKQKPATAVPLPTLRN